MKTAAGIEAEREQGKALLFGKSVRLEQKLEELAEGQTPQTVRTVIPFQIKSINDEERTIEFVGSTATKDRYGDVIEQNWELGNFVKNPVVPWGHDYSMPPVAKALEVGYTNGNLTFKAQFATGDEYAWADTIYKLYKGGYLRAFSVGFIPLEYDGSWDTGYIFKLCELLEVSCVTVPANPEALVLAYQEGVLSESERQNAIKHAERFIKALTLSDDAPNNELMDELKSTISSLTTAVEELTKAVVQQKTEDPDDAPKDDVTDTPEKPGEPEQDASGGTDEPAEEVVIDPAAVKSALKAAVQEELDYQRGIIN